MAQPQGGAGQHILEISYRNIDDFVKAFSTGAGTVIGRWAGRAFVKQVTRPLVGGPMVGALVVGYLFQNALQDPTPGVRAQFDFDGPCSIVHETCVNLPSDLQLRGGLAANGSLVLLLAVEGDLTELQLQEIQEGLQTQFEDRYIVRVNLLQTTPPSQDGPQTTETFYFRSRNDLFKIDLPQNFAHGIWVKYNNDGTVWRSTEKTPPDFSYCMLISSTVNTNSRVHRTFFAKDCEGGRDFQSFLDPWQKSVTIEDLRKKNINPDDLPWQESGMVWRMSNGGGPEVKESTVPGVFKDSAYEGIRVETQDTLALGALARLRQGITAARKNDIWGGLQQLLQLRHLHLRDPFCVLYGLIEIFSDPRNQSLNLAVRTSICEVCLRLSRACYIMWSEGTLVDSDVIKTRLGAIVDMIDETKRPENGLRYRLECSLTWAISLPLLDFGTALHQKSNVELLQRFVANQTLIRGRANLVGMRKSGVAKPEEIRDVLEAIVEIENFIRDENELHRNLRVVQIEALTDVCLTTGGATPEQVDTAWGYLKPLLGETKRISWLIAYTGVSALEKIVADERSVVRKDAWQLLRSYEKFQQLGLYGLSPDCWRIQERVLEAYVNLHHSFASSLNATSLQIAEEAKVLLENQTGRDFRAQLLLDHRSDVEELQSNLSQNWPREKGEVDRLLDNHFASLTDQLVNELGDQMKNLLVTIPLEGPAHDVAGIQTQSLQEDLKVLCDPQCSSAILCACARKIATHASLPQHVGDNIEICGQLCRCLMPLLKNSNAEVQSVAAWAIANIASYPELIDADVVVHLRRSVASLLETGDSAVKCVAAWAIANIALSTAVLIDRDIGVQLQRHLVPLLATGDAKVKSTAAWAIANIASSYPALLAQLMEGANGVKLRQTLVDLLETGDTTVKSIVAWAIANIASKNPFFAAVICQYHGATLKRTLLSLLRHQENIVKANVAWAIANIASSRAGLFEGGDDEQLQLHLVPLLATGDAKVKSTAAWAIANIASSYPALLAQRQDGHIGVDLRNNLVSLLTGQESSVVRIAAWAVANIASSNLTHDEIKLQQHLVPLLRNIDPFVRSNAAWAIANLASSRAALEVNDDLRQDLVSLLTENDAKVKSMAAWAIANIASHLPALVDEGSGEQLCEQLVPLLHNESDMVKANAAWAIANIAASRDRFNRDKIQSNLSDDLLSMLLNDNAAVRSNAAWAIANIASLNKTFASQIFVKKDARLCEGLTLLLQDYDATVKSNAAWAIANLASWDTGVRTGEHHLRLCDGLVHLLISGDVEGKKNAAWAIANLSRQTAFVKYFESDKSRTGLVMLLRDGNEAGKSNAAIAIARIAAQNAAFKDKIIQEHGPQLQQSLEALLKSDDRTVKQNASDAMESLGFPQPMII